MTTVAETVVAMDERGRRVRVAEEREVGATTHGDRGSGDTLEHTDVGGGLWREAVAEDRGHGDHLDVGGAEREQHGKRIVDAGIGVDQHPASHASSCLTRVLGAVSR